MPEESCPFSQEELEQMAKRIEEQGQEYCRELDRQRFTEAMTRWRQEQAFLEAKIQSLTDEKERLPFFAFRKKRALAYKLSALKKQLENTNERRGEIRWL